MSRKPRRETALRWRIGREQSGARTVVLRVGAPSERRFPGASRARRRASVRRILRCCPSKTDYKACAVPKPVCAAIGEEGVMEWTACVGIDWADQKHSYA